MQLNEIIEENTLESISRKTRLSSENLEKLFARDFGAFRKVQALGFISILEREYRADLSDLRAECVAYFSEGSPVEKTQKEAEVVPKKSPNKAPIMDPIYRRKTPPYIKPALIGLIVLGLLYGAWQTLSSTTTQDTNLTQNQKGGFFASIVQQAKSWIGGEDNTSDSDALPEATQGAWEKDSNQTKPSLVVAETPKRPHTENQSDTTESKDAQKESAIIRKVKAQQAQAIAAQKAAELETMQKVDNAIADAGSDTSVQEKPLAVEVPSIAQASSGANSGEGAAEEAAAKVMEDAAPKQAGEEAAQRKATEAARLKVKQEQAAAKKAAQEKVAAEKAARLKAEKAARLQAAKKKAAQEKAARLKAAKLKAEREKAAKLKAAKEKAAAEAAAAKGKIVIRPRAKIWIGKVNLATMQRSTVTTDKPFTLDNLKGRWIVATGHGRFSLKIGNRVFNYNDSKKHFLIIQKGTAHEIPHATFQKLNKSKVW